MKLAIKFTIFVAQREALRPAAYVNGLRSRKRLRRVRTHLRSLENSI